MKKYFKKSLALLLALLMALSTMSVMALASGYTEGSAREPEQAENNSDYDEEPDDTTGGSSLGGENDGNNNENYDDDEDTEPGEVELTIYIQPDITEARPGDVIDVSYVLGPVEDLMRFTLAVSVPDGLIFERFVNVMDLDVIMFAGEGEFSYSGTRIQAYCYYKEYAFTSTENFKMFSARYIVSDDAEEGVVTFGLESAGFTVLGGETVNVNIVSEPIQIVVVDTGYLENLVTKAETYLRLDSIYTKRSLDVLEEAISDAVEILDNIHDYYQDDVDNAINILNTAIDGLIPKASTGELLELSNAISEAEMLDSDLYTADSWAVLASAVQAAEEILYSGDASVDEVNEAIKNIISAEDALVLANRGICGDNLIWFLDDKGTLTISGTGDMYDYTSMGQAPWSPLMSRIQSVVIENGATSIGSNAFFGFSYITSVVISDTVESIGTYAFMNCSGITELTIPDSMISIGYAAFESCKQLCDVNLGNGLVTIGDYAFSYCSNITSIAVPDSVISIGISAFYSCNNLAEVTLGKSLTSIGNYAFNQCYGIKEIIIPSEVTYIGDYAFNQCANLTKISFEGDAPSFGVYCFMLDEATAYYPHDNATWTADIMKNYGGSITWETEDHNWGAVTWKWSDDYKSATASRTCASCGVSESVNATISSVTVRPTATEDGETTYIAVAIFNDLTLASDSKIQILAATGTPTTVKNGFDQDGSNWYYYVNGKVDTSCNDVIEGTVNGSSGWWYVVGGQVQLNYTGVANYANDYGWWYIENGKVNFNKTGIEQNNCGWWRIVNGKVDFSCNSVEQNDYGWWYVVGGQVQFSYTGVANYANAYGWWYISGGKVDFSRNSVEQNAYGWWYVTGGKVDFGYTGVANYANDFGWWYISGGQVDFNKTSVEPNAYGWWRVENGKVNFSFTGWASNSYGTWYCENGKVDFSRS